MRNCPVCGESFGDELNFCDVDGTPLERDPADLVQAKNKLWSILGVALLLGALVISALSIVFLPKGRVSSPAVVSSEPQPAPASETKLAAAQPSSTPEQSAVTAEPETPAQPDVAPEVKKREAPLHENANLSKSAKAAAQSGEEAEKPASPPEPPSPAPAPRKTEAAAKVADKHDTDAPRAANPPAADPKPAVAKSPENSNSKKKGDDKDKKKGGFFKVFKKIFGKD